MYLMYIDESGDTATLQQAGSRVLVLTGCIIDEKDKRDIESRFRDIKQKYYRDPGIEIKSNYLRYANPRITDLEKSSPIKLYDQGQYDALQIDIQAFLKSIPIILISIVIDKKGYWGTYPSQNPYHAAYIFLMERFQTFLGYKNALGLCIIDPREGRVVDKRNIDKELNDVHLLLQWEKGGFWKPCPRIIEKVLFSDSSLTIGIQIADLYCYPIYHIFQYNKKESEYEWFDKISLPKLYYHTTITAASDESRSGPQIDGTGLKFFPTQTKKDFRFYQ
ncbi:MAG: Uncharacterized protein Greene101447_416 [Parcubacteria group bacterium Greene1014_47]|nr:MAG: Uncharacterized protein Greene101447_416 [Parcubacteria group bacterium Greene1014_47]